ncbi:hypothetical protein ACHQM5_000277 [Ranunculus cassubicifolius]
MNTDQKRVRRITSCAIKSQHITKESQRPCYLSPSDLRFLSTEYIQTGLLFSKSQHITTQTILNQLKASLSITLTHSLTHSLTHFYTLSGRLVTTKKENPTTKNEKPAFLFYVVTDILSPIYVPQIVDSLFALYQPINHDGHTLPLLAVQVTELVDGIFIGCSFNHVIGDGAAFWQFFNTWSEVSRSEDQNVNCISRPPIINHNTRIRIFHFSAQSISRLKAKANAEISTNKISSFQALAAQVWRSIMRACCLLSNQITNCVFTMDTRSRFDPPLSRYYFGNSAMVGISTTTAGELLSNNLGWSAFQLHKEIANYTAVKVQSGVEKLNQSPHVANIRPEILPFTIMFGMSPKFDVYTNDFGWGKLIVVRSGFGLKFDGKVTWYPGQEGGGSIDLEICLCSKTMCTLELDKEFMNLVSPSPVVV